MKILEKELIILDIKSTTPEESIKELSHFLESKNLVHKEYSSNLLHDFKNNLTSFVSSHLVAIAQTESFSSTKENSIVLLRLEHSVKFGNNNEPVRLLFGLTATNSESELLLHAVITHLIHNDTTFSALLNEKSPESLYEVLEYHLSKYQTSE